MALGSLLFGAAPHRVAAPHRAAAPRLAHADVTLNELGFPGDQTAFGPYSALTFYLPVYRTLRTVHFQARLKLSPLIDAQSQITVTSAKIPLWSASVDYVRKHPFIDVPLPVPAAPESAVEATLRGSFVHVDDTLVCSRFDPSLLFMDVQDGHYAVDYDPGADGTIAGFLQSYSDRNLNIVVPPGSSFQRQRAALRIVYEIEQLYRWRHGLAALRSSIDPKARNIVFGDYPFDVAAVGDTLEVGPSGDDLLDREIDPLLITSAVQAAKVRAFPSPPPNGMLSLRDLGLHTQTLVGDGPSFVIPFNLGRVGGLPMGLRLDTSVVHTALASGERGTINLTINDQLVDSFPIAATGRQRVEFPIAPELVAAANDLRLTVNFDASRDCHVAPPFHQTTLFQNSAFHWNSVTPYTPSVGDFFHAVAGHVAVMLDDERLLPYAFDVLRTLGTGNSLIESIDVIGFTRSIPGKYDSVIAVTSLDRLRSWNLPLASDRQGFVINAGGPEVAAQYRDAFGVLETARVDNRPVMVASYWGDPRATDGFWKFSYRLLSDQTDRVFIFRGDRALYASTVPRPRELPTPFLIRWLWWILVLVVLLALLVVFLARRKRKAGTAG
ncbi:MAG: cellulose biosynthesis cyclic di-GMP-binding regulatory protein BcsB [Candidatus Eremiobacteraeota bacterium]|nr:cellulose biosynthesis cyclic di-GMP-binding regulatory protein BcsB [Candidatus Eremiobacteraeota bacterium]MBV8355811.1 cellulose biosynthesis cyclic di-GMP-binding regulatory protein BcsB [Candidatus Eremiobacteraeota bacterium]